MKEDEKQVFFEQYNNQMFFLGRLLLIIAMFLLLSVPIVIGIIYDATPNMRGVLTAIAKVGIIYIPVGIVEFLVYSPMLGVSGSFLTFLTGNVTNLKVPCVMNARDIAKTEEGTPENEIISSISIATSALVTMLVIVAGVILLVPLSPILENKALTPAFDNVVPALFGALGLKYFLKSPKIAIVPFLSMSILCILVPAAISQASLLMIPAGGMALLIGYYMFQKGRL